MGLGDILGSISPAFGLLSGKGMFGQIPQQFGQSGMGGLLGLLLGGSHGGSAPAASPSPLTPAQPMTSAPTTIGTAMQGLPGMASQPSALNSIGSALQHPSGSGDTTSGLSAFTPQISHSGLAAILQSLGL